MGKKSRVRERGSGDACGGKEASERSAGRNSFLAALSFRGNALLFRFFSRSGQSAPSEGLLRLKAEQTARGKGWNRSVESPRSSGRRRRQPNRQSLPSSTRFSLTLYSFFSTLTTRTRLVTRMISPLSLRLYSTVVLMPRESGPEVVGGGRMTASSASSSTSPHRCVVGALAPATAAAMLVSVEEGSGVAGSSPREKTSTGGNGREMSSFFSSFFFSSLTTSTKKWENCVRKNRRGALSLLFFLRIEKKTPQGNDAADPSIALFFYQRGLRSLI